VVRRRRVREGGGKGERVWVEGKGGVKEEKRY
jgi:hypothetical protein